MYMNEEQNGFPCVECKHLEDVHYTQDEGGCGDYDCCGGTSYFTGCRECESKMSMCHGFKEMDNLEYLEYLADKLNEKQ